MRLLVNIKNKLSNNLDEKHQNTTCESDIQEKNCDDSDIISQKECLNDTENDLNILKSIPSKMNFLMDVPVNLTIELGTVKIKIKDLLELSSESVLVLDKHAGEPLNVLINGHVVATGELVVIKDKYGIRITDIIDHSVSLK